MAENSSIEWTDHTFNPWIGCTRISPGCDHCYAAAQDKFRAWTPEGWGGPRRRTSASNWAQPLRWQRQAEAFLEEQGRRQRVFCASLADVFDNEVDAEWRRDLFTLIGNTPSLDWLLLTKRIGNVNGMVADTPAWPMPNVWLGSTVVNREEMMRDGPKLMATPAHVRFWSYEPAIGELGEIPRALMPDWVIIGGESGPGARSMNMDWARSVVRQCKALGSRAFVKQLGSKPVDGRGRAPAISDLKGKHMAEWPVVLRIRQLPA